MLPDNVDTRPTLRSQDINMQGQATDQVSFLAIQQEDTL